MRCRSGLIELQSGWVIGVAAPVPGQVRMVLQFDPRRENLVHGVKDLRLTAEEALELQQALAEAWQRATSEVAT